MELYVAEINPAGFPPLVEWLGLSVTVELRNVQPSASLSKVLVIWAWAVMQSVKRSVEKRVFMHQISPNQMCGEIA